MRRGVIIGAVFYRLLYIALIFTSHLLAALAIFTLATANLVWSFMSCCLSDGGRGFTGY
jgi:hypothetical protein